MPLSPPQHVSRCNVIVHYLHMSKACQTILAKNVGTLEPHSATVYIIYDSI